MKTVWPVRVKGFCITPGGGLLKYDLGRGRAAET